MQPKIMYIEPGGGLAGAGGRIVLVTFSQTGKTLRYGGVTFRSLHGKGYKANYYNIETGERYWISGPRRDGNDALCGMVIDVDEDVRERYWREIRQRPDLAALSSFRSPGKYSRRKPRPELSVTEGTRVGGNRGGGPLRQHRQGRRQAKPQRNTNR